MHAGEELVKGEYEKAARWKLLRSADKRKTKVDRTRMERERKEGKAEAIGSDGAVANQREGCGGRTPQMA